MKKKFLISLLGFLFLIPILSGCVNRNSREWIENQVSEEVSEIYPTEDLTELFEVLPSGFTITQTYFDSESFYQMILKGDSENDEISGSVTIRTGDEEKSSLVSYTAHKNLIDDKDISKAWLFDSFLIQHLTISDRILEVFFVTDESYNSQNGSYYIEYEADDTRLKNFFRELKKEPETIGFGGSTTNDGFRSSIYFEFSDGSYFSEVIE